MTEQFQRTPNFKAKDSQAKQAVGNQDAAKPRQGRALPPIFAREHFEYHNDEWNAQKDKECNPVDDNGIPSQDAAKKVMPGKRIVHKFRRHGQGRRQAVDENGNGQDGANESESVELLFARKAAFHDEADE